MKYVAMISSIISLQFTDLNFNCEKYNGKVIIDYFQYVKYHGEFY